MKTKRKAGNGNGTPFTQEQLEQIELHELAQAERNGRVLTDDEEARRGSLIFVYSERVITADWQYLLRLTLAIELDNKRSQRGGPAWSKFPHTSADVDAVIRWRASNPA